MKLNSFSSDILLVNLSIPFCDKNEEDTDIDFNHIPLFFTKEYENLKIEGALDIKNFSSYSTQSNFGLSVQV